MKAHRGSMLLFSPAGVLAQAAPMRLAQRRLKAMGFDVAVDASATFSRPGPRLVDGLEALAHVLHPELVPEGPTPALEVEL